MLSPLLAVLSAGLIGGLVAWLAYARLEEPVRGRLGPGLLRGLTVVLLLGAWFLPTLPLGGSDPDPAHTVLLDRSLSMSLPVRPGGLSRSDSAQAVLATLSPDWLLAFGVSVRPVGDPADSGGDTRSLLVPALEEARARGADSVTLLTDGELDDREAARSSARRLGLAVREIRVSPVTRRVAIRSVDAPRTAEVGDSLRLVVEVETVGVGPGPDSLSLSLESADGTLVVAGFAVPDSGRAARVPVTTVAPRPDRESEAWQPFDITLSGGADPLGTAPAHRAWIEILPTAAGAVVVSPDPDWEPHYLLPVLGRSVAGGARAWLRLGDGRWMRSGTDRMVPGDDARVRRDAAAAQLLVIQGAPAGIPSWLASAAARHPRVLFLARGSGQAPGSSIRLGPVQTGEWFGGGTPPPSPIAGYLGPTDYPALPPAGRLYALSGFDWVPLEMRRNRAGSPLPAIGVERSGARRRAVVAAEGTWRWASRAGPARQAYRSVYAALVGWLLEAPGGAPVILESARLREGDPARWRVAPGVQDLELALRDSTGALVWADTIAAPDSLVASPGTPAGSLRYEARGLSGGEPFVAGRPLQVEGPERELTPRAVGPALVGERAGAVPPAGTGRAIWPFVLAALLLCGEWFWRRRIGLR